MAQKLNNTNILMMIFEVNYNPAGLVRFEKKGSIVVLNYLIAHSFRGKGLANKMLGLALKKLKKDWGKIKVYAYKLPENIASIKSMGKVGFSLYSQNSEKHCYILEKN